MMKHVPNPSRFLFYSNRTCLLLSNNKTHLRNFSEGKQDSLIGEKARSTAEEFNRQAKEKAESVTQSVKEAWDDAKQGITGEHQEAKDKHKEKVEKGNYDKTGQD